MQLSHTAAAMSAVFDDPNLVGAAGLVPVVGLCDRIGLGELAQDWIRVPGLGRANAGAKVMSLVVGMVAGADSIDDLDVLRHGGMDRLFTDGRAPATVGQFLRPYAQYSSPITANPSPSWCASWVPSIPSWRPCS